MVSEFKISSKTTGNVFYSNPYIIHSHRMWLTGFQDMSSEYKQLELKDWFGAIWNLLFLWPDGPFLVHKQIQTIKCPSVGPYHTGILQYQRGWTATRQQSCARPSCRGTSSTWRTVPPRKALRSTRPGT